MRKPGKAYFEDGFERREEINYADNQEAGILQTTYCRKIHANMILMGEQRLEHH